MSFGAPQWLWGLLLLPFLAFLFARAERRSALRLHTFVSPRLFPELAESINYLARTVKFALLLAGVGFAFLALAHPRWGYAYDETKRKGLDLIFAVDTSRSMLSNDVQPNRLERVKLAAQDLINVLQGDRVGLIAFAGRAFLQAPLTIDYGAVIESINDLDTKTIPEGGTNISAAINLAVRTHGKSAVGNRALVIFTDGEELSGDALKMAKAAADAGIRMFTIGVGTAQGSLIPIQGEEGQTAFVKDSKGQVVKSKLDEKRLRAVAEATDGFYLHLENGPRTMQQLVEQGLGKMQTGEIDARLARRPIERYEWPLSLAVLALAGSLLINDRKRSPRSSLTSRVPETATLAASILLGFAFQVKASAPGLDLYHQEKFQEAYNEFQKTLQKHPQTRAADKIQFDSGAAAYKMKDYKKALESFSQALLSRDSGLQSSTHYNLGNTLYQRGETEKSNSKKLGDWTNALQHYEQTLKLDPKNQAAKDNYEFVKKKIDELKKQQQQPPPTPTPTPSPPPESDKNKPQDSQQQQQQQQKDQQSQQQNQQGQGDQQKPDQNQSQSNDQNKGSDQKQQQPQGGASPSPSPGETPSPSSPSPSPENGQSQPQAGESPTPSGEGEEATPSPSPGADGESGEPTPTPAGSPEKKPSGDVKAAPGEEPKTEPQNAEAEPAKEGEMSPEQAERLLQSMKDEEQRVQLDERKPPRHVYNDW